MGRQARGFKGNKFAAEIRRAYAQEDMGAHSGGPATDRLNFEIDDLEGSEGSPPRDKSL